MTKTLYLDRNIYDGLRRLPECDYYVQRIQDLVKQRRIFIPTSALVLEETLPVLGAKDRTKVGVEHRLLADLMDWKVVIKSPQELIVDAVNSWATKQPLPIPYYQFRAQPEEFFKTTPQEEAAWLQVVYEARQQYGSHLADVLNWQAQVAAQTKPGDTTSFSEIWGHLAEPLIDSLIKRIHPAAIGRADKQDLLNYRAVKAYVGYATAYALRNVIEGEEALRSDMPDHYHIVSGSIADVFVTKDSAFFDKLSLFRIDGLTKMNFPYFLYWVNLGCP